LLSLSKIKVKNSYMPINSNFKKSTFNEVYYRDKFNMKGATLLNQLQKNPNDLVAKEKLQFIENLLKKEDTSNLPNIWMEWERNNFCWPILKDGSND